jgi:hypothetical protein
MPLPEPNAGESSQEFLDRCMANPTMNDDFPDNSQRFAVCNSQLEKKNAKEIIEALKNYKQELKKV